MVVTQEPAEALAALHGLFATDLRVTREQQDVAFPLVIPLGMVMFDIFPQCPSQGARAKENHLALAFLLHRPDPALRVGIQVRAARGQHKAARSGLTR
jgi:hypothetical protein